MTQLQAPYLIHATTDAKQRLMSIMLSHQGEDRAIKTNDLLAIVYGAEAAKDKSYNNPYNRSLRLLKEEINNEGGMICSGGKGYWWANKVNDVKAAVAEQRRGLTIAGNARKLKKNILENLGGQLRLI